MKIKKNKLVIAVVATLAVAATAIITLTNHTEQNQEEYTQITEIIDNYEYEYQEETETPPINPALELALMNNIPLRSYFPNVNHPNFIEMMPLEPFLNDPFTFWHPNDDISPHGTNGMVVTGDDWIERREQIKDLIQYYFYGFKQPTPKEAITDITIYMVVDGERIESPEPVHGVENIVQITITSNGNTATSYIANNLWIPTQEQVTNAGIQGSAPIIVGMGYIMPEELRNMALERGFAVATLVMPNNSEFPRTGLYYELYPFNALVTEFNTGTIMASAWHNSRFLDVLELNPQWGIGHDRAVSIGVSFAGKRALMAAAMDERVALAVPVESGAFGMAPLRYSSEGRLVTFESNFTSVFSRGQRPLNSRQGGEHSWFAGDWLDTMPRGTARRFMTHDLPENSVYRAPFDQHLVAALVAPRPIISFENDSQGTWRSPYGEPLTFLALEQVYSFLDAPNNLALRVRDGGHAVQQRDLAFVLGILTAMYTQGEIGKVDGNVVVENLPLPEMEQGFWGASSVLPVVGHGTFRNLSEMTYHPYNPSSSFIRWARPGGYTLWTETQYVVVGHGARVLVHTTEDRITWTNSDFAIRNIDVVNGVAVIELAPEEVTEGRYEVRAGDRTIVFYGISLATALRHGMAVDNTNYNRIYGFTSRIDREKVRLYIVNADGEASYLSSSVVENVADGWILAYGAAHRQALPDGGSFLMRNLIFDVLDEFVFEVSFAEEFAPPQTPWFETQPANASPSWGLDAVSNTGFSPEIDVSGAYVVDGGYEVRLVFSQAVNTMDFGIGLNFAREFTLAWDEIRAGTELTISFSDMREGVEDDGKIYIMRMRDTSPAPEGNVISTNGINAPVVLGVTLG